MIMTKLFSAILISGFFFISYPLSAANAHSGHKKEPVIEESTAEDSIYAVEENTGEAMTDDGGFSSSPLSRTDLFSEEAPLTSAPMESMEHMDHSSMAMDHKMPEVELAEHEWVSTKQKGYGVAAGITILSGLVFGFLNFKRPNE